MQENENLTPNAVEEEGFSIRKLFSYFLAYWKLFLLFVVVGIGVAYFYLRNAVPQYQVTAKVLLQDSEKGSVSSSADMLADFGFQAQNTNVENEIEVINSMSVVRGAVFDAGLYVSYSVPGFTNKPLYAKNSPLKVVFNPDSTGLVRQDSLAKLEKPLLMKFSLDGAGAKVVYSVDGIEDELENAQPTTVSQFPFTLNTPVGAVVIMRNDEVKESSGELLVTVSPLDDAARRYMSAISVAPISKTSSVATLAINTPLPDEGVDFLNAVINSYNFVTNESKREVARQTEVFIIERIDSLSKELLAMETRLSAYKKDNQLISPQLDAAAVSKNKEEYTKKLEELDLTIKSSKFLKDFVNDKKNDMKVIPTTFGLTADPSLVALINGYNKEVVARNELMMSSTEENALVKNATARVQQMQSDLRIAIEAFDNSLNVQRKAVASLVDSYTNRYEMSPDIERELLTIERECKIKSDLYVMLLQKYEENALSLAVTANNLRCIDAPICVGQVAPNSKMIYLLALFIALAIPAVIIYIRESMRTKLSVNDEIAKMTSVSSVGSIPVNTSSKKGVAGIVVQRNNNDVMAEAFRSLRTNLQFVMKKSTGKVIMLTSTTSGEGKTFISSNLAMSTAVLGKKVILVGMDIRRPRLAEMFGFDKDQEGLTSYLAADENNTSMLDSLIHPSGVDGNLDVLPAGIVPPNPAELLSRTNLEKAIEYLKEKYDYIILDSAPVGLVSDSLIISRVVDVSLYVVRYDYTQKADIAYLNEIVASGKLENVSVILNGVDFKKKMYGYVRTSRGSNKYSGYGYMADK